MYFMYNIIRYTAITMLYAMHCPLHCRELALQLQSVRMQEEDPTASISSQLLSLEESRQALELRIHYLQTQNAKLLTQIDKLKAIVQQVCDRGSFVYQAT